MIKATYLGNGVFTLMPEYDEQIKYSFEKQEFIAPSFNDDDVDYKSMYADPAFMRDCERSF